MSIKYEFKKIWSNRIFIIFLFCMFLFNLILLIGKSSSEPISPSAYKTFSQNIKKLSMSQKEEYINNAVEKITGIWTVDGLLKRMELLDTAAKRNKVIEENISLFNKYWAIYRQQDYLEYCSSIAVEYTFLKQMQAEYQQVKNYDNFLKGISFTADLLSQISIFKGDTENNYDLKIIEKTKQAYDVMNVDNYDYFPQKGLITSLEFPPTDIIIIGMLIGIASVLILEEKSNGIMTFIRCTPNGRARCAASKIGALLISVVIVCILVYGTNIVYCGYVYGFEDVFLPIQSMPSLIKSTLQIRIIDYIFLFLMIKTWGVFIIGLWCVISALIFPRIISNFVGCAAFIILNGLLYLLVPGSSKLNFFKFFNLVGLLNTQKILGGYHPLYWFGHPVSLTFVELVFSIITSATFVIFILRIFEIKPLFSAKPRDNHKRISFYPSQLF